VSEMKRCTKCGEDKLATSEYFHKRKDSKDGLRNDCKICWAERTDRYYQEHKESIAKYKENYHKVNRESIAKYHKLYRKEHLTDIAKKSKQYYETNKESTLEHIKLYKRENKDAVNRLKHRREARKRKLPHTLTSLQWENIKLNFGNTCAYCGESKKLTIEHFIPLSKMGELTVDNVLPICLSCNCSRGNRDFKTWFRKQPFYSPTREEKIYKYLGYSKDGIQQLSLI